MKNQNIEEQIKNAKPITMGELEELTKKLEFESSKEGIVDANVSRNGNFYKWVFIKDDGSYFETGYLDSCFRDFVSIKQYNSSDLRTEGIVKTLPIMSTELIINGYVAI